MSDSIVYALYDINMEKFLKFAPDDMLLEDSWGDNIVNFVSIRVDNNGEINLDHLGIPSRKRVEELIECYTAYNVLLVRFVISTETNKFVYDLDWNNAFLLESLII